MLNPRMIKLVSMILAIHVLACFAIVKTEAQEQVIRKFTEDLKSDDYQVRQSAIESLVELGELAVPTLIGLLKDEDGPVLSAAARALGRMGEGAVDAVPALIQALQDKFGFVRISVLGTLKSIGTSEALEIVKEYQQSLIQALQNPDSWVRAAAAEALRGIGTPEALRAVNLIPPE